MQKILFIDTNSCLHIDLLSHRVPGNSEGGDLVGGVTPPPGGGDPPTEGQRLKCPG
jgi:hypothetical protein